MKSLIINLIFVLLLNQVACFKNSQVDQHIDSKANIYTLNLTNRNQSSDSEIDLKNKSQFRNVEYTESGLIILTSYGSYKLIKQRGVDNSWEEIKLSEGISCLDFLDKRNGWAIDWKGIVWQTHDGANSWNQIGNYSNKNSTSKCNRLQFTSLQIGWLTDFTGLFKTTDGGQTWHKVTQITGDAANLFFINSRNGWVTDVDEDNNTTVYSTSDEGSSWNFSNISGIAIDEIYPLTVKKGWMLGKSGTEIYSTNDTGKTLDKIQGIENTFIAKSIFCLGSSNCFVAGSTGANNKDFRLTNRSSALFKTTNNGLGWSKINIQSDEHFFEIIKFFDPNFGVLAAQNTLYETTDGGNSWTEILNIISE